MSGLVKIIGIGAIVGLFSMESAAFNNIEKKTPVDSIERSIEKIVSPLAELLPQGIRSALGPSGPISTSTTINDITSSYFERSRYPNSLPDTVGNYVFGIDGDVAGRVYDVVVDTKTGDLEKLVVAEENEVDRVELSALPANDIQFVNSQGNVRMSVEAEALNAKIEKNPTDTGETSLRDLRGASVYDHEGRLTGHVTEITYKDKEAQRIYFGLANDVTVGDAPSTFSIPYENADIKAQNNDIQLHLTPKQTVAVANSIVENSMPVSSQSE